MSRLPKSERLGQRQANAASARQAQLNASQSTAQLIFGFLQSEPTPRDAAATLAAVNCALIWAAGGDDEAKAERMMAEMTKAVMNIWRAQRDAAVN